MEENMEEGQTQKGIVIIAFCLRRDNDFAVPYLL